MMRERKFSEGFTKQPLADGVTFDLWHEQRRVHVQTYKDHPLDLPQDATHFGFTYRGTSRLTGSSGQFDLQPHMYFSQPGPATVGGDGSGLVVTQFGYHGLFQLGGPTESIGRLQYIDGCSDTLLLSPVVLGEPCLNLLVIPPHTSQTPHTHPSFRAGLILAGHGHCRLKTERVALEPGDLFVIKPDGMHSFHTTRDSLTVIAFHPDSDFGPHRDNHPMVNRTIVNGTSAAHLSVVERRIRE